MKFTKDFLLETLDDSTVDVVNQISDSSRWSIYYDRVIKVDGKFYQANYSVGATEQQDERPYEYDGDEIECREVFPVQKTITIYE